jgi:hypothetical protein
VSTDECLALLGDLMAGLAVPVSLEMPLGKAGLAWSRLHGELAGFGWATPEQYECELRKILGFTGAPEYPRGDGS